MTVQELIDKLSALPRDMLVIRPGYEGGVAEATSLSSHKIKLHVNPEWYYGPHEIVPFRQYADEGFPGENPGVLVEDWDMEAVLIS
jgi:hypothetical protein